MDISHRHELFEMALLDHLHRTRALDTLVFGGGTMLRLCHELKRYSVDLDFWFIKDVHEKHFFHQVKDSLAMDYEITDAQIKHFTILFELRSPLYPKRLKIEVRRQKVDWDYQEKIAFSKFGTQQVIVKALTLEQSMQNKVAAFLDRGEIRDCFDIEFLLRRNISLPSLGTASLETFQKRLKNFKKVDFKVKLGSILEPDMRSYYISQEFSYLQQQLPKKAVAL